MWLYQVVGSGLGQRRSRRNGAKQDGSRKNGGRFVKHLCFSFNREGYGVHPDGARPTTQNLGAVDLLLQYIFHIVI
jgi:hypothetical protein